MAAARVVERVERVEQELSKRISKLEEQVSRLEHQAYAGMAPDRDPWWKEIVGVYKDDPEFEEAMRLGNAYRQSLRPAGDSDA